MQNTKELNNQILRLSMLDTARNSMMALPVVMLLEVYMIISWIVNVDDKSSASSLDYLFGYILMFVVSGIILYFIQNSKKNIDQNYQKINFVQHILAIAYILWAVSFTYVGSEMRGHFDYLIFITFVTIIPLFCYLNNIFWVILQLAGTACMFYFASHHDRFFAFCINFSVFTLISIVAGLTMHYIRRLGYLRQIELEEERNNAYTLAHKDKLTGLPNRQSFDEAFEMLSNDPNPEDIIMIVCDVNGLKKVNDQLGHKAGDELIQGAAFCLQQVFRSLGTIYRVGGDEFSGILHGTDHQLQDSLRQFEVLSSNWKGQYVNQLSISVGHSSARSNPSATFNMLMTQADNAMYEAKRKYYQSEVVE